MARPAHSLSTLRSAGYPNTTQDSLPAAGQALPDGIGYPQGSNERFLRYNASPFPKLPWRTHTLALRGRPARGAATGSAVPSPPFPPSRGGRGGGGRPREGRRP